MIGYVISSYFLDAERGCVTRADTAHSRAVASKAVVWFTPTPTPVPKRENTMCTIRAAFFTLDPGINLVIPVTETWGSWVTAAQPRKAQDTKTVLNTILRRELTSPSDVPC